MLRPPVNTMGPPAHSRTAKCESETWRGCWQQESASGSPKLLFERFVGWQHVSNPPGYYGSSVSRTLGILGFILSCLTGIIGMLAEINIE
jgi:hypothetical protein